MKPTLVGVGQRSWCKGKVVETSCLRPFWLQVPNAGGTFGGRQGENSPAHPHQEADKCAWYAMDWNLSKEIQPMTWQVQRETKGPKLTNQKELLIHGWVGGETTSARSCLHCYMAIFLVMICCDVYHAAEDSWLVFLSHSRWYAFCDVYLAKSWMW